MTAIKICGITRLEDGLLAAELGAAALGFVFWPASPRFIDPYRARPIVRRLPPLASAVGVFVDQPPEFVRGVAGLLRLGAVQLHGREDEDYCGQLRSRVIKAIPMTDGIDFEAGYGGYPDATLLLDAHDPERFGGTGRTVDWARASQLARHRRVILSGGLRPGNVTEAIRTVRPYGIDVSSGVEARPGIKDGAKLRAFFEAARAAAVGTNDD
jgi:phosphoribosylanthranilate isomerase